MRRDAYTPMSESDEPCTITCEVVADVLEESRLPRMADFVRDIGRQIRMLMRENDELRKRLDTLRPPAPVAMGQKTYRAKPESDG